MSAVHRDALIGGRISVLEGRIDTEFQVVIDLPDKGRRQREGFTPTVSVRQIKRVPIVRDAYEADGEFVFDHYVIDVKHSTITLDVLTGRRTGRNFRRILIQLCAFRHQVDGAAGTIVVTIRSDTAKSRTDRALDDFDRLKHVGVKEHPHRARDRERPVQRYTITAEAADRVEAWLPVK